MKKKCSCCGSETILQGEVVTAESLNLFFVDKNDKKKLFPKSKKILAYACSECGNVNFFIDIANK